MLLDQTIPISISCQQFEAKNLIISGRKSTIQFHSIQKASEVRCPHCGGRVHVNGTHVTRLKDAPLIIGTMLIVEVEVHRYLCQECGRASTEEIPFREPGTRVTVRAAGWICGLLRFHLPISAVSKITGISWDTIRNIQRRMMAGALESRWRQLRDSGYRPRHLAVDEFAIHKGHSYATCVMDLDTGDIIWVGKGRSKEAFGKFFEDIDLEYLSEVEAFAMDMNASYNILVERNLPNAEIVYDRYHMQAQYGKDVLGVVRLSEARRHRDEARAIEDGIPSAEDAEDRRRIRNEARREKALYSRLKGARWTLLANGSSLDGRRIGELNEILGEHEELATCYAMKEEMAEIFRLCDEDEARSRWRRWFDAALESGIPALERFARLKERRIDGLVAHARYNISTGRLEGFNNKIKVAKRVGYGYRDDDYFFTLVRYLALPSVRHQSHTIP